MVARALGIIGERREVEGRAAGGHGVEADGDRVTRADGLAAEAEIVAERNAQPVGEHDEARGDVLAGRERDALALAARGERGRLGVDDADVRGDQRTHGVHERRVIDAMLVARALLDDAAEAGDPGLTVGRRVAQHIVGEPGLLQDIDLDAVELLAAEVGRIDGIGIDEHRVDAGAAKHRRSHRARQATTDNHHICILHRAISVCVVHRELWNLQRLRQ